MSNSVTHALVWFLGTVSLLGCPSDDGDSGSAGDTPAEAGDGIPTAGDGTVTAGDDGVTGPGTSAGSADAGGTATTADDTTASSADDATATAADTTATGGSAGSGSASSSSDGGGVCAAAGESCLQLSCCDAAMCCSGIPIPRGEAVCYEQCPDSDRNLKKDLQAVDRTAILRAVAALPITEWSYNTDRPGVRHIGPMAQDFKAAFDVGGSDRAIAKVDADGVALAAIGGLLEELERTRARVEELEARLHRLESAD